MAFAQQLKSLKSNELQTSKPKDSHTKNLDSNDSDPKAKKMKKKGKKRKSKQIFFNETIKMNPLEFYEASKEKGNVHQSDLKCITNVLARCGMLFLLQNDMKEFNQQYKVDRVRKFAALQKNEKFYRYFVLETPSTILKDMFSHRQTLNSFINYKFGLEHKSQGQSIQILADHYHAKQLAIQYMIGWDTSCKTNRKQNNSYASDGDSDSKSDSDND
eukprot:510662_1